mgnify:CR=1 FL=1
MLSLFTSVAAFPINPGKKGPVHQRRSLAADQTDRHQHTHHPSQQMQGAAAEMQASYGVTPAAAGDSTAAVNTSASPGWGLLLQLPPDLLVNHVLLPHLSIRDKAALRQASRWAWVLIDDRCVYVCLGGGVGVRKLALCDIGVGL